jgi:uncharacterized membrane protein YfcA
VIGSVVGFVGGYLGVGGGAITIPLLYYWAFPDMHVSPEVMVHLCLGTSLAVIIPPALSSALAHRRTGNIDERIVLLMVIPGIAGSFLGSTLSAHLRGPLLKTLFATLLIALAVQMFLQRERMGKFQGDSPVLPIPTLWLGLLVGFFSGFFGLGGGVVAVPLMLRFLHLSIHRTVGISITVVFFASLVGTVGYIYNGWGHPLLPRYAWGFVYPFGAVLAGVPSVFVAYAGAHLAHRTHPTRLRKIFAFLLLGTGVRMLF